MHDICGNLVPKYKKSLYDQASFGNGNLCSSPLHTNVPNQPTRDTTPTSWCSYRGTPISRGPGPSSPSLSYISSITQVDHHYSTALIVAVPFRFSIESQSPSEAERMIWQ
ncbi:hypothetical protein RRG08_048283 [Elysia crispata]|uniref:Uncharacterized protein n=1 Tax=Elysia crispata TaxID=231223 RepID=A0AAE0ZT14_9GAST|nr:hypothetical protein RRG08_048283 [Elysia crispata]